MPIGSVTISKGLNEKHQLALIKSITDPGTMILEERRLLFEGIDLLRSSRVIINDQNLTFPQFFNKFIDQNFTNKFLDVLENSKNIYATGQVLKKEILTEIRAKFLKEKWFRKDIPETRFLIIYCLYWWNAMATGYAFEIEVFRDLQNSGVKFKAHDLQNQSEKYSFADLTISRMNGDIKSSTYFFIVIRSANLEHDFYITRYYDKAVMKYHWFVILKSEHWHKIDGKAESIIFPRLPKNFIRPIKFEFKGSWWHAIDYHTWKNKILIYQQRSYQNENN